MIRILTAFLVLISFHAQCEQLKLNDKILSIEENCLPESDICSSVLTISSGDKIINKVEGLHGPFYVSQINAQIFSCEDNSIMETKGALLLDTTGKRVGTHFHEQKYLRDCGMTEDQGYYWLLYNLVESGEPVNKLIVLDSSGAVVFSKQGDFFGETEVKLGNGQQVINIQKPDWPG
jgi:hypothetical protein